MYKVLLIPVTTGDAVLETEHETREEAEQALADRCFELALDRSPVTNSLWELIDPEDGCLQMYAHLDAV